MRPGAQEGEVGSWEEPVANGWGVREITALRGPAMWVGVYRRMGRNVGGESVRKEANHVFTEVPI